MADIVEESVNNVEVVGADQKIDQLIVKLPEDV